MENSVSGCSGNFPQLSTQHLHSLLLIQSIWTIAHQAPPSSIPCMGFPMQEYWSGLPFLSPGDPPNPGIKLRFDYKYYRQILTVKGFDVVNKAEIDVFWNSLPFSMIQGMLAI